MIDEFAKTNLHNALRYTRDSLLSKLEGLSEYVVRRPMTRTGTNLLGLVKHLGQSEARYFGEVFDRPYPDGLPSFFDPGYVSHDHLWVPSTETRADVFDGYRRACAFADETIEKLPIDAPGHVPWWPQPDIKLFNALVHLLTETSRHAGHADILREELDGVVGGTERTAEEWAVHRARVEQAARDAGQ
ncbi:DinB family protein [Kribbella sandramycini]|uniref:DinB family protein n=1 Tax=Kribbella sandramycini TaxID=60450 RepID=A0A7Y4NZS7_9ACTN|nr:DinB family protein [Kribbella sandramycini]MBB6569866.1 hypothetical protein [Kribbella sandramycini]NOL40309.1 DinB family protein [Kribbella sandramycini]